jgi:uncharacterized protein
LRQTNASIKQPDSCLAKILLLVLGLVLAYWIFKGYKRKLDRRANTPSTGAEDMVRCAQCGVHLPRSESLKTDEVFYCCPDHRRAHQGTD